MNPDQFFLYIISQIYCRFYPQNTHWQWRIIYWVLHMSCLSYYFSTLWGDRRCQFKLGWRVFVRRAVKSTQNDTSICGILSCHNVNKNFDPKKQKSMHMQLILMIWLCFETVGNRWTTSAAFPSFTRSVTWS